MGHYKSTWIKDIENPIILNAQDNAVIDARYKLIDGSEEYISINDFVYDDRRVWKTNLSLPQGKYLLSVKIETPFLYIANRTRTDMLIGVIDVVSEEEYTHLVKQNVIIDKLTDIDQKILSENMWKVVG